MNFNEHLKNLANYEPGKDIEVIAREYGLSKVIKLASNENPLGTSPKAAACLRENAHLAHLYPDDSMSELKGKLARHYSVSEKELIIGAGSDQIIEFVVHSKLNSKNAFLQSKTTFAMYQIYAKQVGTKCYKTPSITHELAEFKELYSTHKDEIKVVFLCVPNNPIGECLDASEVLEFIEFVDKDCLVVLDCAYNEFASFKDKKKHLSPSELINKYDNVLYLGTFSKLYALGGLRVGYGIANEAIIKAFYKLRAPFNVANLSLKAACAALDDKEFVAKSLENNFTQMRLYEDFARQNGIKFIDSYTNFITYFFERHNATELANALLKKGIIIRDLKSYGLNAIRITIGLECENELFFKEFKGLLG